MRGKMYHALAMVGVGIIALSQPRRIFDLASAAFCCGVLIFSGCLYAYVLTGAKAWAMIVPAGGLLLLVGWFGLMIGCLLPWAAAAHPDAEHTSGKK